MERVSGEPTEDTRSRECVGTLDIVPESEKEPSRYGQAWELAAELRRVSVAEELAAAAALDDGDEWDEYHSQRPTRRYIYD